MLNLSSLPELRYNGEPAFPPQEKDLQRLYDYIVKYRALTVLEFGCGYSTFAIAAGLKENENWYQSLKTKWYDSQPPARNSNMFQCFSLDTNKKWLDECKWKTMNKEMEINFYYSPCRLVFFRDQLCHIYDFLPDIVPDFIYLDGPDPKEVEGSSMGMSWKCKERTPMSADILYMESTLIPGTKILIDGRTNNARFLARNLKRNWKITENREEDYTFMELDEPRLGKVNVIGRDILECLGQ